MPVVINRHHYPNGLPSDAVYIGRGTPLGNEVSTKHDGEVRALWKYKTWLWEKLVARDPRVMAALASIGPDTAIVCSCAPKPCHGDVILWAWEWLAGKGEW